MPPQGEMAGEEDHYIIVACHDGGSSAIDVVMVMASLLEMRPEVVS